MHVVAVPDDGLIWGRGGTVGQAQPPPRPYPEMTANDVRVAGTRRNCMHLYIRKWRPIDYSFVCILISPLRLIFTLKFFCPLYMLTRRRGLINMQIKE